MPRRIDVELTSRRDDGTWNWRAAGAREPRGVLDGALLEAGAKVGDVIRAEAEIDVDGITISSVLPPKEARREPERIELIRPARDETLVTSTLATRPREDGRGRRRDGDRADRGDRPDRRGGDRPDRGRRPDRERPAGEDRGEAGARPDRRGRGPSSRPNDRPPRERAPGDAATQERRPERARRPDRPPRGDRPARPPRPAEDTRPKPKRLRAGRVHRKAVLDALPPEQVPIAEQVLIGGIPAVRQAIDKQNEELRGAGQPSVKPEPLLAIAEQLLPKLRTAEWHDRAEAALADIDELDLRDLRSVVVAADAGARDDVTRELAAQLREALTRRVDAEHTAWLTELTAALTDGRVVRALRLSSRPPKAGALLPPDITTKLTEGANAALTADTGADRWAMVLDAVAYSPVRRNIVPASIPETPSEELLAAVRKLASRVPEVAGRFGIQAAPEAPRPKPPRRPGRSGGPAIPAPPPVAEKAQDVEGPAGDEVAVGSDGPGVPTGENEATTDGGSAPAVVVGVADEDDVVAADAEPVEDRPELLRPAE